MGFLVMFGLGHFQRKQDVDLHSLHASYILYTVVLVHRCLEITQRLPQLFGSDLASCAHKTSFHSCRCHCCVPCYMGNLLGEDGGCSGFWGQGHCHSRKRPRCDTERFMYCPVLFQNAIFEWLCW